jgi:type I restriction enzyme M protein
VTPVSHSVRETCAAYLSRLPVSSRFLRIQPMNATERAWYYRQIEKLDPSHKVVAVDQALNILTYSEAIRTDESRVRAADPEEVVRALALCLLASKKYKYEPENFYIERYYKHGHPQSKHDEVDLIISDQDDLPFALWDFKSAADFDTDPLTYIQYQLFGTAPLVGAMKFLVFATIKPTGETPVLTLWCIDRTLNQSFESWEFDGYPHTNDFPIGFADPAHKPYVRGGDPDLRLDCTQADFRDVATTLHEEFFGEHPDTVLFTNLMKCLLAKIYDEKQTKTGLVYKFQVFYKNGKEQTAAQVFKDINELYGIAYNRYIDSRDKDNDKIDVKEFSPERVKTVVKVLQGMSITSGAALHGDVIGAFFEEILRSGFKQDKGMYFTHANLVYFMLAAMDLDGLAVQTWKRANHPENRLPFVIDPACGSGAFLLRAMNVIREAIRSRSSELVDDEESKQFFQAQMSEERPNYWAERFLYGMDPKFVMAITAKINMVLHGDGSTHVFKHDALRPLSSFGDDRLKPSGEPHRSIPKNRYKPEVAETFDVVVSNPPFGVTLTQETRAKLPSTFSLRKTSSSEAFFLERWFQLLKPSGRLGVVVPESLLNSAETVDARLLLYRFFWIRAIVSLPRNLFIDTPTLTSLLFAQKKTPSDIQDWDSTWEAASAKANSILDSCTAYLKRLRRADVTPKEVEDAVLTRLAPLISRRGRLTRRGASPLSATLPSSVTTSEEAGRYYTIFTRTSAFRQVVRNYIFHQVCEKLGYEYPVYIVDEVGFKLSKRKERARSNQLTRFLNADGQERPNLHLASEHVDLVVTPNLPERVLDYIMRDVEWS